MEQTKNKTEKQLISIWKFLMSEYPEYGRAEKEEDLELRFSVFERVLSDIPPEILMAAAVKHVASCKWFPKVSELRDAAFSLLETGSITSGEAWEKVCNEIRSVGFYGSPNLDKQIMHAVDAMGGWKSLCSSENNIADRAHFMKIYEAIDQREREERRMLPEVRELVKQITASRQKSIESGNHGFRRVV